MIAGERRREEPGCGRRAPVAARACDHYIETAKEKKAMQISAYLSFNGNCREAMTFYKDCLGGELAMQTVGETAAAGRMPPEAKNRIMHASLANGAAALMASDTMGPAVVQGNAISLMLNWDKPKAQSGA
jgi:predicted 3-demethylubiquinone-9 3-methyltransferase (glyoxalase superfamily)